MRRLLVPSSALLWGLQLAFLSPALALILVDLYGATTAEVGWVLAIYNASGFVASLLMPAYADKKHDYLGPMLVCGALTLLLAVVLALATSLPIATIALVVIGGPAGVGSSMLYAHLRHSGARPADIVNTRAIVSVAWVAGPPLATFIIGWFGNRAILLAIAAVAVLNIATTALMIAHRNAAARAAAAADGAHPHPRPPPRTSRRSAGRDRADHGGVHPAAGHQRHRDDDHDRLRHRDPAAGRDVGRHRPRRRRRPRGTGAAAHRPAQRAALPPRPDRHQLRGRHRLLPRTGLRHRARSC